MVISTNRYGGVCRGCMKVAATYSWTTVCGLTQMIETRLHIAMQVAGLGQEVKAVAIDGGMEILQVV